jgi:hypothetical protein
MLSCARLTLGLCFVSYKRLAQRLRVMAADADQCASPLFPLAKEAVHALHHLVGARRPGYRFGCVASAGHALKCS